MLMMMRAVEFDRYGPADVLQVRQVPQPVANANEALVRVHAASVNPIDNIIRSGTLKFRTGRNFPKRTGIDFCGEILEVNGDDPHLRAGDRAWGVMPLTVETGVGHGSAAEFVTIPTSRLTGSPARGSARSKRRRSPAPAPWRSSLFATRPSCSVANVSSFAGVREAGSPGLLRRQ